MKNRIIISLLTFSLVIFLSACGGNNTEAQDETTIEETATAMFYCPMKCEGDKTYSQAGKCPKCNMDLVQVGSEKETGTEGTGEDGHEGHDHGDHEGHNH